MRPRIAALLILAVFLSCRYAPIVAPISGLTYCKSYLTSDYPKKYYDEVRRYNYIQSHAELSERDKELIRSGNICLSMSKEDVEASWGKPHDINKTVGVWGVHEQWVYGYNRFYGTGAYSSSVFIPSSYLYFKNGYLDSWQQ